MGLINRTTTKKSFLFGKDRPFGGSSNQPYIQKSIDVKDSEVGRTGGPDFLLRGGTLVPTRIGNDVSRMTQMFFDLKSPNGLLFTAKQNILSRSAVAVDGIDLPLNAGAYLPTSTILQSGVNIFGLHSNKQGINPLAGIGDNSNNRTIRAISEFDPLGQPTYRSLINGLNPNNSDPGDSKLLNLSNSKLGFRTSQGTELLSYQGGPGSILGVGKTIIKKGQPTNLNLENLSNVGFLPYEDLKVISDSLQGNPNSIIDFRQEPNGTKVETLDYTRPENRIEGRVHLGNPGKRGVSRKNYQKGLGEALDKLTALPLYKGPFQLGADKGNDLVKFRIGVIDNTNPSQKTFIHFRAFIDSMSDNYSAQWNNEKLMGRGEEFYKYNGFTRQVSLSWTVAAQSKQELIPMYQKLNYLASSLTPDYSNVGYMGGNLVSLTLGGYFYEQPGIITSMTLEVPSESPWEIGIPVNEGGTSMGVKSDKDVKELPHIIKVTGVNFIPIHTFTPQLQQNNYDGISAGDGKYISSFGKERYIALSTGAPGDGFGEGGNNNYGTTDGKLVNGADNYINSSIDRATITNREGDIDASLYLPQETNNIA